MELATDEKVWEQVEIDRADWQAFKKEIGITDELEASAPNHIEVSAGPSSENFYIGPSEIAGEGTLAAWNLPAEYVVGPAWLEGKRTVLGCKGNHSLKPTARIVVVPRGLWLVTNYRVEKNQELTTNYRETKVMLDV